MRSVTGEKQDMNRREEREVREKATLLDDNADPRTVVRTCGGDVLRCGVMCGGAWI